jgi:hypothetical protein
MRATLVMSTLCIVVTCADVRPPDEGMPSLEEAFHLDRLGA